MTVEHVDHMGDDLRVANVARVSFGKWIEAFREKDAHLIRYLARHKHWTPFAHCQLSLRISAPIFVARQLVKHQIGLVWNEVSRRYVDDKPVLVAPDNFRMRAENVKQGSSKQSIPPDASALLMRDWRNAERACLRTYRTALELGVAPELARTILPQTMQTEWIWTGSLMAFARVCQQRLDPHAQLETRWVAQAINRIALELFPVSWEALMALPLPKDDPK